MRSGPLLLVAGFAASACGRPPAGEVACLASPFLVRVEPGLQLDCAAVESDVAISLAALESGTAPARWRLSLEDLDGPFSGLPVFVHRDSAFQRDGRSWVGRFSVGDGIELGSRGDALPHELMHALDVDRGQLLTAWHSGWDWDFDDQVTAQMSGAWVP